MRRGIIKALKIGGILMGGIIAGAVLMNLLHMYVRPAYRETIRIDLETEQKFLAGRAAQQGDQLRALVHRWNVVDAEARNGFRVFRKEQNKDIDSSFLFPFHMLVLNALIHPKEGMQEKGPRIIEGVSRGRLALALESIGAQQEADKQWEMARMLTNKNSIEDIRKLILGLREQEDADIHRQAEEAVLGDDTDKTPQ
jgi:hypothetical protein